MINYMKSETYRLKRNKKLHMTSVICFVLIAAAAITLYLLGKYTTGFPYATSSFFYSNVVSGGILILIIAFLFNLSLTGKDLAILKQSVSFGISKPTIFWSKLVLTVSYFLAVCAIGILLVIGLGENLFVNDESMPLFIIACINMIPIILSGFFTIHVLKILRFGDVNVIIILLFVFMLSGTVLRMILHPISGLDQLYKYAPSTLLNENLTTFMEETVQLDPHFWLVGLVISILVLTIGVRKFAKQNID